MACKMAPSDIEPLEPVLWFDELRKILDRITAIDGEAPDAIIRKAYYLSLLAPEPLRPLISSSVSEDRLEGLLEGGAYDEAVISLINPLLAMALSRSSQEGQFEAILQLPDGDSRGAGRGETVAKALMGAWIDCFVSIARGVNSSSSMPDRDQHRSRCAGPQHSTRH